MFITLLCRRFPGGQARASVLHYGLHQEQELIVAMTSMYTKALPGGQVQGENRGRLLGAMSWSTLLGTSRGKRYQS